MNYITLKEMAKMLKYQKTSMAVIWKDFCKRNNIRVTKIGRNVRVCKEDVEAILQGETLPELTEKQKKVFG